MNVQNLDILKDLSLSAPAASTSTVTGAGVDLAQVIGSVKITQEVGTVSGTTPTLDGKIQDSADNSAFADVSGLTFTEVTASTSLQSIQVDTRAVRRYIRYVGTIAGTTPSFGLSVRGVGHKKQMP